MKKLSLTNSLLAHLAIFGAIHDNMFCTPRASRREVNGNFEKLVKEPKRVLRSFLVHGTEIKAYSKRDAVKKYNHLIKSKNGK